MDTAFQFAPGDALNYGETRYGERYSQAMEVTGHSYQSLANYAWVAKAVPYATQDVRVVVDASSIGRKVRARATVADASKSIG
jgi:hypothetical protein